MRKQTSTPQGRRSIKISVLEKNMRRIKCLSSQVKKADLIPHWKQKNYMT